MTADRYFIEIPVSAPLPLPPVDAAGYAEAGAGLPPAEGFDHPDGASTEYAEAGRGATRRPFVYQAVADPTPPREWSLAGDCERMRDLFRRHGFTVRSKDARVIWERRSKEARSTWLPLPDADEQLFQDAIRYLHDWMAEDDVEPEMADLPLPAGVGRPQLIDLLDGPCEICAAWGERSGVRDVDGKVIIYCQDCGERIVGMEGNSNRGVESCVPHHYHVTLVNGHAPGRKGVPSELCKECAIKLRLKVYSPDEKDKHGNYNPTADQMRSYRG